MLELSLQNKLAVLVGNTANEEVLLGENNLLWYYLQSFTEPMECHRELSSAVFQVTYS